MRLIRISLATKYRLLFGAAVLLIIGAALCVPWYRMEALVLEQPYRHAQRIADEYFRNVLPVPGQSNPSAAGVHGAEFGLFAGQAPAQPHFARLTPDPREPDSILNPANADAFVAHALGYFARNPKRDFTYRTSVTAAGREFEYAHAVRVTKRCLNCHDEGKTARPYRENELAGVITVTLPSGASDQELLFNRLAIVAAGALAGILALLVFYVITQRFILSPIHDLREVAVRVTAGDMSVRSDVQTGDEFEHLSNNFNAMLEQLRLSQDDLKKANQLLDEKLGRMAESNVALFESNKMKSEFIANVSHELRTPLTSIIGFAELLREGPTVEGNGRVSRYAENILISGRILLEIINDLLDLAKIEAGRVQLHIEPVDIREVCTTLIDFTKPLSDKKQLEVGLEIDPQLPVIQSDRGKLWQVLFNLLSNAIKFTPEQGRIQLAARRDGPGWIRILVSDSGPGIAPEHQAVIFEKFRQLEPHTTRTHQGTGLGLAIAKELAYLMGGELGVESQLGLGATFSVRLPEGEPAPRDRSLISLT